jgi:hypothetical protein
MNSLAVAGPKQRETVTKSAGTSRYRSLRALRRASEDYELNGHTTRMTWSQSASA